MDMEWDGLNKPTQTTKTLGTGLMDTRCLKTTPLVTGDGQAGFFDFHLDFSAFLTSLWEPCFRCKSSNFASVKNGWRLFFLDLLGCSALVELFIGFLSMELNVFVKQWQCETH